MVMIMIQIGVNKMNSKASNTILEGTNDELFNILIESIVLLCLKWYNIVL